MHTFFFCVCSRKWVERLCKLTERHGTNYWWELTTEKLLGRHFRQEFGNDIQDLERGTVSTQLSMLIIILTYSDCKM